MNRIIVSYSRSTSFFLFLLFSKIGHANEILARIDCFTSIIIWKTTPTIIETDSKLKTNKCLFDS